MTAARPLCLGLALLAFAGSTAPAGAQTLDVLRGYGMIGTWSIDCAAAPSRANWHVTYAPAPGGAVRVSYDRGADEVLGAAVDSAGRLTSTTFRQRLRNDDPRWGAQNGNWCDVVSELIEGGVHSLSSTCSGGVQLIKDGKILSNGAPAPILKRCRD